MPASCSLRTAATADGRSAFAVVTRVPSTSEMTSLNLLTVAPLPLFRRLQHLNPTGGGDDDIGAASDKQPALDKADDRVDPAFQRLCIGDCAELAIEYVVAAIGDERVILGGVAQSRHRAQPLQGRGGRLPAELRHLDRHRTLSAQPVDQLFLVDDDNEAAARRGDDLLAQERAA